MVRKLFPVALVLAVVQCIFSLGASAQSNPCITTETEWSGDCPPGSKMTPGPGNFLVACTGPSPDCVGSSTYGENHTKCPNCGSPISLADGNTYIEEVDVRIPGLSGGLTLVRTWNSKWPSTQSASQVGLFGPNWRSTFEERVFLGADGYMKYARGDGDFWSFASSNGKVVAPANVVANLTLIEPSGSQSTWLWVAKTSAGTRNGTPRKSKPEYDHRLDTGLGRAGTRVRVDPTYI